MHVTQKNLSKICEDVYGGHHYAGTTISGGSEEATCSEEGSGSHHCIRCDAKGASLFVHSQKRAQRFQPSGQRMKQVIGTRVPGAEQTRMKQSIRILIRITSVMFARKVLSECADTNKDHKCDPLRQDTQ